MLSKFYTQYLQGIFTDRERELNRLERAKEELKKGRPRHMALWGLRRLGKTMLIMEFIRKNLQDKEIIPVYIDFQEACTSPEIFAQRYLGNIAFWYLTRGEGEIGDYLTVERLVKTMAMEIPALAKAAGRLIDELSRARPDQALLLKFAFDLPEELATAVGSKVMMFLDEFPEIITFSHYPKAGDSLKLFRASLQRQNQTLYVLAGSAITLMERMVKREESPLFLQLETLELSPFTREDTLSLIEKLGGNFDRASSREVFRYTSGHPFYIISLAQRTMDSSWEQHEEINVDLVRRAFMGEVLSRHGQIYNYCQYIYDVSLQRAKGYGVLKALLQILSEEEGLILSEVARRLRKSNAATADYLHSLMEVDLIIQDEGRYFFRDSILRFWVAYATRGIELDPFPGKEAVWDLVHTMEEKYIRVSSELGLAKESQIRELIRNFRGHELDGSLFHIQGLLVLPHFKQVCPYLSPDGQVEIDALAEDGEKWAMEVKWRNERVSVGELESFLKKARPLAKRLWFISKGGFTPEAMDFATHERILLTDKEGLERLAKLLKVRFKG